MIVNTVFLTLISNYNFGLVINFLVGGALLLHGIFFERILLLKGTLRQIRNLVYISAVFALIVITVLVGYGSVDNVTYNEDALIVLGAGIKGEELTYPLLHRLNKAVEYSKKNKRALIIVSGGQGPQENITEALAMERFLIKNGIPVEKIIKEEKASSTYENFAFSRRILDGYFKRPYKVAFITNNFHVYRATRLARIAGIEATHCNAHIEWYTYTVNYFREFTAVLKLWVLKR